MYNMSDVLVASNYTQQFFFSVDTSFNLSDNKWSFPMYNVVVKSHTDKYRKIEHNLAVIILAWPNM